MASSNALRDHWSKVLLAVLVLHGELFMEGEPTTCVFYETTLVKGRPLFGKLLGGGQILCAACCYAMWTPVKGKVMVLFQGCLEPNVLCPTETCEARVALKVSLHCSCPTDLCNGNLSSLEDMEAFLPTTFENFSTQSSSVPLWACMATILLILVGSVIIIGKRMKKSRGLLPRQVETVELLEVAQSRVRELATQDLLGLHFSQVLHKGSSAVVWTGTFQGDDVAIKSFAASCMKLYLKEWRVLSCMTPMNHENVVRFIAAGWDGAGQQEMAQLLILQYHPAGSLRSFLIQHTSDWDGTLCLAVSLARGLAFLHAEVWKDGWHKPSIAHRDLTSQNVLVKADRTCAISDFDLAQLLPHGKERRGQDPDPTDITMAGTLQYMSPEILDGSVNLKDWESTLKQADVYSMGLLLWEMFSRCSNFYPGGVVPEFHMAFEAELGRDPSFAAMRTLVLVERRRPVLPEIWKEGDEIYRSLWDTLENCWDPDAEARLTAMCTEQRLRNLMGSRIPSP